MAGFVLPAFSVGGSGNVGGIDFNVIYTPSNGGWTPTIIPSTTSGGGATVVQSPASQMMLIGAGLIGVLLLVFMLKS